MTDAPPQPTPPETPPATPEAGAAPKPAGTAAPEGVDKQLLALAVGLLILAAVVLGMKWTRIRVDWALGNLMKARETTGVDDPACLDELVGLAESNPAALTLLRDEVLGSARQQPNKDFFFRGSVLKAVGRVHGIAAANVLHQACIGDTHAYVRAVAYEQLAARALLYRADERDGAIKAGLRALNPPAGPPEVCGEPDVLTRAYAAALLARLEAGPDAVWPVLLAFRDARPGPNADDRERAAAQQARLMDAEALRALAGPSAKDLALDPAADQPTRDAQVRAWETWWTAQGHEIPKGQRLDEVYGASSTAAPDSHTTAGPPSGPPNPNPPAQQPENR